MKKEAMNTLEVAVNNNEESSALVVEIGVSHSQLKAFLEELCMSEEFSILRDTLRFYDEELMVH